MRPGLEGGAAWDFTMVWPVGSDGCSVSFTEWLLPMFRLVVVAGELSRGIQSRIDRGIPPGIAGWQQAWNCPVDAAVKKDIG